MSKVIVIGAGASGVITSLIASQNNEVILLDKEDKILKKVLLTGNGKCNYWNKDISIDKYNSNNIELLNNIINDQLINNTYQYLESLGLYPFVKNGYYYPYSNSSSSVREILLNALKNSKVELITNCKVENIYKEDNKFIITSDNKRFICDKVVLSTGGNTYPKTGSDGSGYNLSRKLGHTIIPITSALCPLVLKDNALKECNGIRCNALVSVIIDDKIVREEVGEIQITNYGISGICIFNLSSIVSYNLFLGKKVLLKINFFDDVDNFYEWFDKRNSLIKNRTIEELLESLFNYKLMFTILKKSNIKKDSYWNDLNKKQKKDLVDAITDFKVEVVDVVNDKAQISRGGVSLKEIDVKTLQSNICKGLYFTGEILDIDGICGGFNLALAFITGYIVGRSI